MIGRFVTSKAGHDKDSLYVVVAQEGDFLMLSDGRLKPIERPKKKRRKHIQLTDRMVEKPLMEALEGGSATNEQVKYAIKHYKCL